MRLFHFVEDAININSKSKTHAV